MQDLEMLEKLISGTIVVDNQAYAMAEELCALGTRFPGTPGEKRAQEYICRKLEDFGLKPTLEMFEHLAWERGRAQLMITSPEQREIMAVSLAGAPSTPPGGIEGEILFLGNGTPREFEALKDKIRGRIVCVTSLSPRSECSPPRNCHRRTKYGRAVAYGAKAFLFMNSQPGMLPQNGSTRQNVEGEIPAVTIPYEEGEVLRRHLGKGPVTVRLAVENRSYMHTTANIVADISGKKNGEVVLVGGHYDCHDNSHGALDNGAGVAILLELARIYAQTGVQPEKTVRFVFFAVEEMAAVGSSFYVKQHRHELDSIHLFINVDGVAQSGAKTFDTQGFDDLAAYMQELGKALKYPLKPVNPSFSGDALPFVMAGVPTAALKNSGVVGLFGSPAAEGGEDRGWGHTAADTIDKLSGSLLYEPLLVLARVLLRAASHSGSVAAYRRSGEAIEILARHGMDEVLRFMKWPTVDVRSKN